MEKPAVVFSEEGFKMFTDLIRDLSMGQGAQQIASGDDAFDKADADALVKEYFKRPDKPDLSGKAEAKYDMDDVAMTVFEFLNNNVGTNVTTADIQEDLANHNFHYKLRSIAPVMKGVMNRMPGIVRVDAGVYTWQEVEQEHE